MSESNCYHCGQVWHLPPTTTLDEAIGFMQQYELYVDTTISLLLSIKNRAAQADMSDRTKQALEREANHIFEHLKSVLDTFMGESCGIHI